MENNRVGNFFISFFLQSELVLSSARLWPWLAWPGSSGGAGRARHSRGLVFQHRRRSAPTEVFNKCAARRRFMFRRGSFAIRADRRAVAGATLNLHGSRERR